MIYLSKSILSLTIIITVMIASSFGLPNSVIDKQWQLFKKEYDLNFESALEDSMRMQIFALNKEKVDNFNLEQSNHLGYKQALNHLSVKTDDEYKQMSMLVMPKTFNATLNELKLDKFYSRISLDSVTDDDVPKSVDWTKVPGRVTKVKSQGDCGSSWAFAATGALEGQLILRGRKNLTSLSDQSLIDCSVSNKKCDGGFYGYAFDDIRKLGGIQDEFSYPYTGSDKSPCLFDSSKSIITDDGYIMLPSKDERKLKIILAKFGPVPTALNPTLDSFRNYKTGVYKDDDCSDDYQKVALAVLIVGYGTDVEGGDYWLVKNSWSEKWGDKGYMRIARNSDNMCGIASIAAIPDFL